MSISDDRQKLYNHLLGCDMTPTERKPLDVKRLYTDKIDAYLSFNSVFRTPQALRRFFEDSDFISPDIRILDTGCGTGAATFALLQAFRLRGMDYRCLHAFDFTPAMLDRFRQRLIRCDISDVELREDNVLELGRLLR
ncbi:MAG: methyltransferase domain-containing protein [Methylococcales bacterium]|nr:methyltransferase domain-containing protein [Methylococcales bacterium]